eukprot:2761198-Pyramimonas_sp.AAC.1
MIARVTLGSNARQSLACSCWPHLSSRPACEQPAMRPASSRNASETLPSSMNRRSPAYRVRAIPSSPLG